MTQKKEKQLKDGDYIAHDGCWITCGTAAIRIRPFPDNLSIGVYKLGHEDDDQTETKILIPWSDLEPESKW